LFVIYASGSWRQVWWQLEPLRIEDEELGRAYHLAQDFRAMITSGKSESSHDGSKKRKRAAFPNYAVWPQASIAITRRSMVRLKPPIAMGKLKLKSIV
jgi:hypothetical protein